MQFNGFVFRIGLVSAALVVSSVALADTLTPVRKLTVSRAVTIDTNKIFPQISGGPPIFQEPENPEVLPRFNSNGIGNSLVAGKPFEGERVTSGSKFPGIGLDGLVPLDPDLAAGPDHIVQVTNANIAFFDKKGTKLFQQRSSGFFSGLGATSFQFDPKVVYDLTSGRFFALFLELDDANNVSKGLIAVSDDADPRGTWFKYRVELKLTQGSDNYWLDYPGFAVNGENVVVTGNMFPLGNTTNFGGNQFIVIKKAPMLTGAATSQTSFVDAEVATTKMAVSPDNVNVLYGVTDLTFSSVRLYAIKNDAGGTPVVTSATVNVPAWTYSQSSFPSSSGSFLDSLNDRMMSASMKDGRLVSARTIAKSASDKSGQIRWYDFNVGTWPASGTPTLAQSGNIPAPDGAHNFMPAIANNRYGDIAVLYTRSSSSQTAQVLVSARKKNDPLGGMGTAKILTSSAGSLRGGVNRWGDYHGVVVDPNLYTFWGVGSTVDAQGRYSTEIQSWLISSPASQFEPFPAKSPTVYRDATTGLQGKFIGGSESSLIAVDGSGYSIGSVGVARLGQVAALETKFLTPLTQAETTKLSVAFKSTSPAKVSQTFWLYNWNTNAWEALATTPSSTTLQTIRLTTTPAKYISNGVAGVANGTIRLVVRGLLPLSNGVVPGSFTYVLDRVQLVGE